MMRLKDLEKEKETGSPRTKTGNGSDSIAGDAASAGTRRLAEKNIQHNRQAAKRTAFSPRAATQRHGPAMRMVANVGDWDNSLMVIPGGESGQLASSHYSDQFEYWYEGQPGGGAVQ